MRRENGMYGKSCVLATGTVRVDADGDTGRRAAHARLIGALRGEHASSPPSFSTR